MVVLSLEQFVTATIGLGLVGVVVGITVLASRWLLHALDPTGVVGCVLGPITFVLAKGAAWLVGGGAILIIAGAALGHSAGVNWEHVLFGAR